MPKASSFEIRFQCQTGCRKCCEVSGYVYLTEEDVSNAARYLKMPQADFEARFLYRTRHMRRIRKPRGGKQCPFLDEKGCSIHAVKPVQCRLFPFWPELVENRQQWKQTAEWCPGIGQGKLVQIGTALELAQEMREKYPDTYA
ncbi:YkgJ family cysteine cluster protein [Bryobacter aggregatus]|uniref:YkgJ family cysteine cluster protein n=1 Tax=Bryobacter aggregatus TaxID=360054 RepID=UPI0006906EF2|nr:YkgJ family cysteine cluster protein [Bryobacter aggregatus]